MESRILVADGETWAEEHLRSAAGRLGAEVSVAGNGIELIERFKRDAPDLVVVDSLLAKINGVDSIVRIRATAAGRVIPIILTSSLFKREGGRKLQRKTGFSELLEKPFTAGAAFDALARWLSTEETQRGGVLEPMTELLPGVAAENSILDGRHLGVLILEHIRQRDTGVLTLERDDTIRQLAFERGVVVHARSSAPRDRIDRVLARVGRITFEQQMQLQQALAGHATRVDIVPMLVKLGWLWAEEVRGALLSQMTHITLRAALATRGRVRFQPGPLPAGIERQDVRAAELAFWAMRRFDGVGSLRNQLPSPRSFVARSETADKARTLLNLNSLEEQILGLADGRRRLGDLLSIARFGPVDVARVLHCLLSLGVMVARAEDAPADTTAGWARPSGPLVGQLVGGRAIEVFARLWLEHESGNLRLERPNAWREVLFDGGEVVWAASNLPEHWLGAVLRETGEVTESDLADALRLQAESSGRRIGGILLESKALTLEELDRSRRTQIQRIIVDALSWEQGTFSFTPTEVSGADRVTLSLGTPDLILAASRRAPAPASVTQLLATPDTVLMKAWDSDQIERALKLERGEKQLLDSLESGRAAAEVVGSDELPAEALKRCLHALLALEVVRAARGRAADSESATDAVWQPADLVRDLLVDGLLPDLQGDEISGVIQLGARSRNADAPTQLESRVQSLTNENAALKKRLAELEDALARRGRG